MNILFTLSNKIFLVVGFEFILSTFMSWKELNNDAITAAFIEGLNQM